MGELADLAYLASTHVRVCLQGHLPFMAGVLAVYETMKALRNGTDPRHIPNVASSDLLKQMSRDPDYQNWIKKFLTA
jgi:carboxyvinyl-carboxyphosphonate phosphorylmutase